MRSLYLVVGLITVFSFSSFAQNGQFRSRASGPWSTATTWDRDSDSDGIFEESPSSLTPVLNTQADTVYITSGFNVSITANTTIDQVKILNGGTLTVNSTFTATCGSGAGDDIRVYAGGTLVINGTVNMVAGGPGTAHRITVDGTVRNAGVLSNGSATKLKFQANSDYFHLHTGAAINNIPRAGWDPTSTMHVTGINAAGVNVPGALDQSFGNFIWDTPNMVEYFDMAGGPFNITGNFTVNHTGAGGIYFNMGGGLVNDMDVQGNFTLSNGSFFVAGSTGSAASLTVNGNLTISGGTFGVAEDIDTDVTVRGDLAISGSSTVEFASVGGIGTIHVEGDYSYTGGIMQVSDGVGRLNFSGSDDQVQLVNATVAPANPVNYSVDALTIISIPDGSFLGGTGGLNLAGTMRLGSVAAAGALQTGTSNTGNIRLPNAGRQYVSGATIVYSGIGPQFIGNAFPPGGDVNLEIDNTAALPANRTVTLSSSLSIVALRTLFLTSGSLVIGTQTLTINGTVTGSGGLTGGPLSKLVIGGTGDFGTLTFSGTNQLLDFTLNRTGVAGQVTLGGNLEILGAFTQTSGSLNIGTHTLNLQGNYSRVAGSLVVNNTSILIISGSGTLPSSLSFGSSTQLGTLTIDRAASNVSSSASLAINNLNLFEGMFTNGTGIAIAPGGTITRGESGSLVNPPNNTTNAYNVVYDISSDISSGPELPVAPNLTALANLTKLGASVLQLSGEIAVNGVLHLSNGELNSAGNNITLYGNFITDGSSTLTGSDIIIAGATQLTTITSSPAPTTFTSLIVNNGATFTPLVNYTMNGTMEVNGTVAAGTATTTFAGTSAITGTGSKSFNNLSIPNGATLTAPTGNFNVAGGWNNTGTFVRGVAANTVTFNGTTSFTGAGLTQFSGVTVTGTLTSPPTLRVAGNLTISGTFNPNNGTVRMNGTGPQTIGGTGLATFTNLTVTNPSSVSLAAPNGTNGKNLTGVLTLSAGVFNPNGNFTLISGLSGDARVAPLAGGASFGANDLIVQRYLPNTSITQSYRYLASPVLTATAAEWKDDFPITGGFNDPSTVGEWPAFPNMVPSSISMYRYFEPTSGTPGLDNRYQSFPVNGSSSSSNPASLLENGRGYTAYVRQTAPITIEVRGHAAFGQIPVNVTNTDQTGDSDIDGWNLIGNPYPAAINWDNVALPLSGNVQAQIAIKDNTNNMGRGAGLFTYYTHTTGDALPLDYDGTIAQGQAFWVKVTSDDAVTETIFFEEDDKIAVSAPGFIKEGQKDRLRINVAGKNLLGNPSMDELLIGFSDNALDGADKDYDAYKLKNEFINFSSLAADGKDMAINIFGQLTCSKEIPLLLKAIGPGSHALTFSQFESLPEGVDIRLLDAFTGKTFVVTETAKVYDFEITATAPNSSAPNRFKVFVGYQDIDLSLAAEAQGICNGNDAQLRIPTPQAGVIYHATLNGTAVSDEVVATSGSELTISIPKANLTGTDNTIVLMAKMAGCGALPLTQPVTVSIKDIPAISNVTDEARCGAGTLTLKAVGAPQDGSYKWYLTEGATDPIAGETASSFTTPNLTKTKTYFVAAVNSLGCEGARKAVTGAVSYSYDIAGVTGAQICGGESTTIAATGAPADGSYRWYVNQSSVEPIPNQSAASLVTGQLTASNTYYVTTVNASGCESVRVPVTVDVTSLSVATIAVEGNVLTSNSDTGNQWYLNGTAISGATGKTYTATESGIYKLVVIQGTCSAQVEKEFAVTGDIDIAGSKGYMLYPNPSTGMIYIEVVTTNPVEVSVKNQLGAEIANSALKQEGDRRKGQLDITGQVNGMYLVVIKSGEQTVIRKIVKN